MRAHDVEAAASEMVSVLSGHTDRDWSVPAGPVTWSCRDTTAHVADDLFTYATQLATEAVDGYLRYAVTVDADAGPAELLRVVEGGAALLAGMLRTAHPGARGWHPDGVADPAGFAAMGVVEILVHTHDVATGLGVRWTPPADACRAVLARLFPDVPDDRDDPAARLLWATGRGGLAGTPRREDGWRWDASVRT